MAEVARHNRASKRYTHRLWGYIFFSDLANRAVGNPDEPAMTDTTKALLGLAALAVVGGGIYYWRTTDANYDELK